MEIKPTYYDGFRCSADKCPMTCCMQWKIAVDEETLNKWKTVDYKGKMLDSYVKDVDGGAVIGLNEEKICPFLNKEGLCNLVIRHGDGIISHTCDIFPRQIHEFGNRREYSLVSCCPEVIDILREASEIEFTSSLEGVVLSETESEDVLFNVRNLMIELVKNERYPVEMALLMTFYVLLDIYDSYYDGYDEADFIDLAQYRDEKTLKELYEGMKKIPSSWEDTFTEDNEIWLDVVENYRKEGLYSQYIKDISQYAEELLENYTPEAMEKYQKEFKDCFKEYEELFRKYLISEFFTNLLIPESDMEGMVVMMQWIAMEYVVMRQGLFLKWMKQGTGKLSYEMVRDYMVVISRMTGYDEEDIVEYFENSFQSMIWEWGYMALIVGIR